MIDYDWHISYCIHNLSNNHILHSYKNICVGGHIILYLYMTTTIYNNNNMKPYLIIKQQKTKEVNMSYIILNKY
jgi:hypothetical protein